MAHIVDIGTPTLPQLSLSEVCLLCKVFLGLYRLTLLIVIATLFTLIVAGHGVWIHFRTSPLAGHGKVYAIGRIALEALMILLWIGTAALMLRDKGEVSVSVRGLTA